MECEEDLATRRQSSSTVEPSNGGIFAKNRNMWERRASSQSQTGNGASDESGADDNGNAVKAGFRSNRDFWEQRVTMRQKQTPGTTRFFFFVSER